MDTDTLVSFRKVAKEYLDSVKAKFPDVDKVLSSQEAFIDEYAVWRSARSGATPWPYETYIQGQITE